MAQITRLFPTDLWKEKLIFNKDGFPKPLEANAILFMREHPEIKGLFGLDEFHQRACLMRRAPWSQQSDQKFPRPVSDADLSDLLAWIQYQGVHIHGRTPVRIALASVVRDNTFHPVRDYLDKLEWDNKPRLDSWLTNYLGVDWKPNYTGPAGRMWMTSGAARIYRPGCIAKYVLIIEGPQDLGKSTALRILGGEWFTDDIATLGTKDSQMQVGNAWIVELAELDSARRADINAIKSFISRPVDRFRPPYGEHLIEQLRQSVMAATVNPAGPYLHDETGAVRFWPAAATKIKLDELEKDRDQLWAEAVALYKQGAQWWPDNKFSGIEQQEERTEGAETDPWFDIVRDWLPSSADEWLKIQKRKWLELEKGSPFPYETNDAAFTSAAIMDGALSIPKERMDRKAELRIGAIMRLLGYKSGGVRVLGEDEPVRRWKKRTV